MFLSLYSSIATRQCASPSQRPQSPCISVASSWADTACSPEARQSVVRLSSRIGEIVSADQGDVFCMVYGHTWCLVKTVRRAYMVDETKRWFTPLLHLTTRWTVHAYLIAKPMTPLMFKASSRLTTFDGKFNSVGASIFNHALTIHVLSS
jgi:hypothetical protein